MAPRRNDLQKLPTVGEDKEQLLYNHGYYTYEKLAVSNPVELYLSCGIVLSSATQVITKSIQLSEYSCPDCSSNLKPTWNKSEPDTDTTDLFSCVSCNWSGSASGVEPEMSH